MVELLENQPALIYPVGSDPVCDGCAMRAGFILNTINLTSLGVPNVVLQSPYPSSGNCIAWQPNGNYLCIVPVQSRTWGQIKSIYR